MESTNYKIFPGFLEPEERLELIDWVTGLGSTAGTPNLHLVQLGQALNGSNTSFDIGKTQITQYISQFQSTAKVIETGVPDFVDRLITKIATQLRIDKTHSFLQAVDMHKGGTVAPHYDAALEGYINYKCNISVLAEPYEFCIGEDRVQVEERDLYCFEASLYKHWTPTPFSQRRILLSCGFMLPYSALGRDEDDVRVRLSRRIEKYFQQL